MVVHELKTAPGPFRDVRVGLKTYEVRKNDRGFAVGDFLLLREYDGVVYGGGIALARVVHMTDHRGPAPLPDGVVVLGIVYVAMWGADR